MAGNFTIDDGAKTLIARGYNILLSGNGRGIGLSVNIPKNDPEYKPGPGFCPERVLGFVSQFQQDEYFRTSESVEDFASRIENHIVHGKRTDMPLQTIRAIEEQDAKWEQRLNEQTQKIVHLMSGEIAELKAKLAAHGSPASATAIPVPPVLESVQINEEGDPVTHLVPDEPEPVPLPPPVVEAKEPKPEPKRPVTEKKTRQPFPYSKEQVKKMAAELGIAESDAPFWKYKVRAAWDKHQKRLAKSQA